LIEGVLIPIVGVLIAGGIVLWILRKKRKRKNEQQLNENNLIAQQTVEKTNTTNRTQLLTTLANSLQKSEISYNDLTIENKIGTGSYGKVCLGKWNAAPVALKFCKKKGNLEDFMREIQLMMYVSF
jgi:LPXTG-motif cell wall-anchored protein